MKKLVVLTSFLFLSCTQLSVKDEAGKPFALAPDEISFSVMSYNIENLFDLKEDSTKKTTLEHLAQVIRSGGPENRGADLLILQEVENEEVLLKLRDDFLSDLGYKNLVLIGGSDERRLEVAFLSRFNIVGKPKLHQTPFSGILEATFRLPDNKLLTAYGVHFSALHPPTSMPVQGFKKLNELVSKLPSERLVVAGGDFNLTPEEDLRDKVLDQLVEKNWFVAHQFDIFLDMILFSKTFQGSPWRFRDVRIIKTPSGVSEHWPIQVIFTQKLSVI